MRFVASLVLVLAMNDFRSRYRSQALGLVWALVHPLAMMGILTFVFRHVAKVDVADYPVFVLIGIVYWQFATRAWTGATRVFVANSSVSKRATFPRFVLPISVVFSWSISAAIDSTLVLLIGFLLRGALHFGLTWVLIPVLVLVFEMLVVGLALLTSTLFARFRDVLYMVETSIIFVYWATPVLYPMRLVPERVRPFVYLNPFASFLEIFRAVLMTDAWPDPRVVAVAFITALLTFALGSFVYDKNAHVLSDYV
ncbi:MAG: ABC transporter permease [Polyangiaceae bacterium]